MTNEQGRRALLLNGSPRKKGNTAVMNQWIVESLKANQWEVEQVDLYPINLKGCSHCDACQSNMDRPGCVLKDEISPLLDRIPSFDLIIIASPVYCWAVTGCMSSVLDRFYSLFKFNENLSFIRGKKILGAFTAGGGESDGMDLCVEMSKRISQYMGAKYVGTISVTNAVETDEVALREDLKADIEKTIQAL